MSKTLTVSLVTYNGAQYLPFCLESLFNQSYKDWKLFILDNGSTDESLPVVQKLTQDKNNVTILPSEKKNIGFAAGHNKVTRQTHSDYVLLLNQDVIMAPEYMKKLVEFMEAKPRAGSVQGLLLRWDVARGAAQLGERTGNMVDSAGLQLTPRFQIIERGSGEADIGQYNANEEVFGVSGALPLIRRRALDEAGLFDERLFSYKEDVDLAFRLQHAGWRSFRAGGARAYHERGLGAPAGLNAAQTARRRDIKSARNNYLSYRNHWYILIKDVSLSDWLRYGLRIGWYELQKLLFLLLFEQKTLLAWREVLRELPALLKERGRIKPKSVRHWVT